MEPKLCTIDVTVVHETEKAVKVQGPVGEPAWIPKSVIELYEDGTATPPEEFAAEKGII